MSNWSAGSGLAGSRCGPRYGKMKRWPDPDLHVPRLRYETLTCVCPPKKTKNEGHRTSKKAHNCSRFLWERTFTTRDGFLGHQFNTRLESLLQAINRTFYWRILKKKIILVSGFNNPYKKSRKQETGVCSWIALRKNQGRKPDKNSSLCPETFTKNAVQEFYFRKLLDCHFETYFWW